MGAIGNSYRLCCPEITRHKISCARYPMPALSDRGLPQVN